jgi:hypothetical protein
MKDKSNNIVNKNQMEFVVRKVVNNAKRALIKDLELWIAGAMKVHNGDDLHSAGFNAGLNAVRDTLDFYTKEVLDPTEPKSDDYLEF